MMTEYSLQAVKGGIFDRYLLVTLGYGMKTAQFLQAVEGAIFVTSQKTRAKWMFSW
jgi:hypothetical protein